MHPTVVRDDAASTSFAIRPIGIEEAIRRALAHEERQFAETRWSDALSSSGEPRSPIQPIGGATGWYRWNWLWRLRGLLDLLVGGVGMRRGRPHPAIFDPVGWFGRLYWYALFPLHELVFAGMLRAIAREALRARPEVPPLHDDR